LFGYHAELLGADMTNPAVHTLMVVSSLPRWPDQRVDAGRRHREIQPIHGFRPPAALLS
jgi:hypothetical protein